MEIITTVMTSVFGPVVIDVGAFDCVVLTPAGLKVEHCAELEKTLKKNSKK